MSYLKDITIGGVTNDIFFPNVKFTRVDTASAAATTYTTPSETLSKGLYLFFGRVSVPAGSTTGNNTIEASLYCDGALYARLFRTALSVNTVAQDVNFLARADITADAVFSIKVDGTVSKKFSVTWICIKLA